MKKKKAKEPLSAAPSGEGAEEKKGMDGRFSPLRRPGRPAGAFASGGGQLLTFTEKISVAVPPGDTVLVALPHATVVPVEE